MLNGVQFKGSNFRYAEVFPLGKMVKKLQKCLYTSKQNNNHDYLDRTVKAKSVVYGQTALGLCYLLFSQHMTNHQVLKHLNCSKFG